MQIRKAVITAAGRGTRHFPATRAIQKELIPLVDRDGFSKPTIQIIIEEALASGIEEIGIVTSPEDEPAFHAYFKPLSTEERNVFLSKPDLLAQADKLSEISARVTTLVQPTPEGFGHAVWCAKDWVDGEPFLVLLGDHVYTSFEDRPAIAQVIDAYTDGPSVVGVQPVSEDGLKLYGIVHCDPQETLNTFTVTEIVEKPSLETARARLLSPKERGAAADTFFGFFGIYALPANIFDYLTELVDADFRERGEIPFTTALDNLARAEGMRAVRVNGERHDMGTPHEYLKTQLALAKQGPFANTLEP